MANKVPRLKELDQTLPQPMLISPLPAYDDMADYVNEPALPNDTIEDLFARLCESVIDIEPPSQDDDSGYGSPGHSSFRSTPPAQGARLFDGRTRLREQHNRANVALERVLYRIGFRGKLQSPANRRPRASGSHRELKPVELMYEKKCTWEAATVKLSIFEKLLGEEDLTPSEIYALACAKRAKMHRRSQGRASL